MFHQERDTIGGKSQGDWENLIKANFFEIQLKFATQGVKVHRSHFKPIWLPGSQVSIMQIRIGAHQERITITIHVHVSEKNALCRSFRARASFRQGRISWTRINILDKEDEYRGRGKCSLDCFSLQAIKASIGLSFLWDFPSKRHDDVCQGISPMAVIMTKLRN